MFFQFNAVKALYDSGCIIVAAAGNDGIKNEKNQFPANSPGVLSISAFDESDQMAAFSNGGPNIKFGAPGVLIRSTWPKNLYETLDWTSMAAPHVAGIVSSALANYRINPCDTVTYNPTFAKRTQILKAMIQTVDTIGRFSVGNRDDQVGFGIPQADAMDKLLLGVP